MVARSPGQRFRSPGSRPARAPSRRPAEGDARWKLPPELRDLIAGLGQQVARAQAQALAAEQRASAAEQLAGRFEQAMSSGGGASPPSRGPSGTSHSFIDTRLVSEPGYDSGPSSWQAWSFQFRNRLGAVEGRLKERLDQATAPFNAGVAALQGRADRRGETYVPELVHAPRGPLPQCGRRPGPERRRQ